MSSKPLIAGLRWLTPVSESARNSYARHVDRSATRDAENIERLEETIPPCPYHEHKEPAMELQFHDRDDYWRAYCPDCGACGPVADTPALAAAYANIRYKGPDGVQLSYPLNGSPISREDFLGMTAERKEVLL